LNLSCSSFLWPFFFGFGFGCLTMKIFLSLSSSLPGRAQEVGDTIWLCDAQHADSKIFSRSLLAKVGFYS